MNNELLTIQNKAKQTQFQKAGWLNGIDSVELAEQWGQPGVKPFTIYN